MWGNSSAEAGKYLLECSITPFAQRYQALVTSQGRTSYDHQRRGKAVAHSPRVTGIGNRLDAFDQTRQVSGVEIYRCHGSPWVSPQQRMAECSCEHPSSLAMQLADVDILDLAVLDVTARPASISSGLTEVKERRSALTSPYVAGGIDEGLDQGPTRLPSLYSSAVAP